MSEPVIKAVRKARRDHANTPVGQLGKLAAEVRRWKRKLTIAQNKHDQAFRRLLAFAEGQAEQSMKQPYYPGEK